MGYHNSRTYPQISLTLPSLNTLILPNLEGCPGYCGPRQAHSLPWYLLLWDRQHHQGPIFYPSRRIQWALGKVGRVLQVCVPQPPTRILQGSSAHQQRLFQAIHDWLHFPQKMPSTILNSWGIHMVDWSVSCFSGVQVPMPRQTRVAGHMPTVPIPLLNKDPPPIKFSTISLQVLCYVASISADSSESFL